MVNRGLQRSFFLGVLVVIAPSVPARSQAGAPSSLADGVRLHDQGRFEEAIQAFRRGLETSPGDPELIYEISLSLQALGRYDECAANAEPHLKQAGRLKASYYSLIGSCIDLAGRPKSAAKIFDKALRQFPDDAVLLFNAGVTRLRTQEPKKAKALLKKSVRERPWHGSSHLFLAVAFERSGDRVPALLAYVRFLSLAAEDPRAVDIAKQVLALLGQGFQQTGDKEYEVTVPMASSKEEGDYQGANLVMSLGPAIMTTEEWVDRAEGEKLFYRIDSVLGAVEERTTRSSDFARETYLPFTRELRKRGLLEPLVYRCFAPVGIAGMQDWLSANPQKLRALEEFLANDRLEQ